MCGIAGWIGKTDFSDREAIAGIKSAMLSRGPDLQNDRSWDNVVLIHNRLKIIDLSALGDQPMANEDGSVWVIFNGEIYNHHELRKDLEGKGHTFRSRSDTEVIVHLYEELGLDFARHLKGMFAIALYDLRKDKVVLARDRFGIKPLFYYSKGDRNLFFASTLNAIKSIPGLDLAIDPQAIFDFTALFYIPAPGTFYRHIRSLLPGELIEIDIREEKIRVQHQRFSQHHPRPDINLSEDAVTEQVSELMEKAVGRQLESDVPIGSLLSGGIDSSLVSYYAQKNLRSGLHTFNVKFSEKEYDESWAALAIARLIGSHHQTLSMEEGSAGWQHVTSLLQYAGQPFADTSYFAAHGVSALMRKHVTVALSGDGGDEGFGGYTPFNEIEQVFRFNNIPSALSWPAVQGVHLLAPFHGSLSRYSRIFKTFYNKDQPDIITNFFRWIREEEHQRLVPASHQYQPVRRYVDENFKQLKDQQLEGLESLSALATLTFANLALPNDFLFKVDTASMRESLEIRVPMLDEDLFDMGMKLPHRLKTNHKELKYILRKIARRNFPADVANKPKWGFGIPVDTWVNNEFKQEVREYLEHHPMLADVLNKDVYKEWIECFYYNRPHPTISREGIYQRVIMLLALALHLK